MAETNATSVTAEKPWQEMSDEELALSLVDFNLKTIKNEIDETRRSLTEAKKSKLNYASDENSDTGEEFPEMEDEQFDNEKADRIKNLEEALNDFIDEYDIWDEDKDIIAAKDEDSAQLIKSHAALERTRRVKLEENSKPK